MESIYQEIERRRETYVDRLKTVVRQPSVSSEGLGLTEMANLLKDLLKDIGFGVDLVSFDGPPVVLAQMAGASDETVLFYNHYDVQPVDPLDLWQTPPFEPTERGGKLYGRGVADDKGGIIARLCAVESYLATRGELPLNLAWVIEGEEEIGSIHLHQFVAAHSDLLSSVIGCVWEAGGKNARERYEMALGCKGLLYLNLKTKGAARDLHSALAAIAPSPAWRLLQALNSFRGPDGAIAISGFADDVRAITSAQRQALADWDYPEEDVLELMGLDHFIDGLTGLELKERYIFGPTCNIDGFHTGYGGPGTKTVLPHVAQAKVDFRLVPDQRPERIAELVRAHLDREGFGDVEIVGWEGEAPAAGDPDHAFVQDAARAAEKVYGHAPAILPLMAGTGPVYLLCDQFGVPIVTAGVGYADSRAHAPNENVRIEDFLASIRHIATLIDEFGDGIRAPQRGENRASASVE